MANFEKEIEKLLKYEYEHIDKKTEKMQMTTPLPPFHLGLSVARKLLESSARFSYFFRHMQEGFSVFSKISHFFCLFLKFPGLNL